MEKKPPVKGSSVPSLRKKTLEKAADVRTEYLKALRDLEKKINNEGLLYLIDGAQNWLRKQEYDSHIEALNKLNQAPIPQIKVKKTSDAEVEIQGGISEKTFTIVTPKGRSTFGLPEMSALVKASKAGTGAPDQLRALLAWLKRERGDFLMNNGIGNLEHPLLVGLLKALKKKFK